MAVRARPAMIDEAVTGVARRRLKTPDSRCNVTDMTKFTNDAEMMPEGDDPGHVELRRNPSAGDLHVVVSTAEHRGEDHEENHWQGEREEPRLTVAEKGRQIEAKLVQRLAYH